MQPLIFLPGLLLSLLPALGAHADEQRQFSLPPASIAQWYKPANKRQVWLHTMFKLRREMQAVSEYAELQEPELLQKWSIRLGKHYRKIGDMVPEWKDELNLEWMQRLEAAAANANYAEITRAVRKIGKSCQLCHREFRAVTAAIYRAPDFSKISITSDDGSEQPINEAMQEMTRLVNRIKIASEDQRTDTALQSLATLHKKLDSLGKSCESCHKDDSNRERILGKDTRAIMDSLQQGIAAGDQKTSGRALGTFAVKACARCHGIHRSSSDIRKLLGQ